MCVGGGGVTLICSYIRRLGSFFFVQNSEFQHFWGVSENYYFGVTKILWLFFWLSQNWTIFRGRFLCILESFLMVKVQNEGYF